MIAVLSPSDDGMGMTTVVSMLCAGREFTNQLPSICMAAFFCRNSSLVTASEVFSAFSGNAPRVYRWWISSMPLCQLSGTSSGVVGLAVKSSGADAASTAHSAR